MLQRKKKKKRNETEIGCLFLYTSSIRAHNFSFGLPDTLQYSILHRFSYPQKLRKKSSISLLTNKLCTKKFVFDFAVITDWNFVVVFLLILYPFWISFFFFLFVVFVVVFAAVAAAADDDDDDATDDW